MDFLGGLRRRERIVETPVEGGALFQIGFLPAAGGYVTITDRKGNEIDGFPSGLSDQQRAAAMTIRRIIDHRTSEFNWTGEADRRVFFSEAPELIYQLQRCDNLVDTSGNPLAFSDKEVKVSIVISSASEENLKSELRIETEGGKVMPDTLQFIAPGFAIKGDEILRVNDIGENFDQIGAFASEFPKGWLDRYLSVLYSYLDNIPVVYADYTIRRRTEPIDATPVIVFERVDPDNALVLGVRTRVAEFPLGFAEDLDLRQVAYVDDETKRITVRPLGDIDPSAARKEVWDAIASQLKTKKAQASVYDDGETFTLPPEAASLFLMNVLPSLMSKFEIAGADRLKEYKIQPVTPKLNISKMSSGIDFLEGEPTVSIGTYQITLRELLAQYQKYKFIKLPDGSRGVMENKYIRRLNRIFTVGRKSDKVKLSFYDLPELEDLLQESVSNKDIKQFRKFFENYNKAMEGATPRTGVKATLRPYQKAGVKWLSYLYDSGMGGCLADDMGLGKTLQTISLIAKTSKTAEQPTLVVMPRSLIFNWENELRKFAPDLSYAIYHGPNRNLDEALKAKVVLTTYAMVRNDIERLKDIEFDLVVLDESQTVKNITAQQTQAVLLLKAKHRLALSGTPIENNLGELYALFRFLNPGMFGTPEDFNARYAVPVQKEGDRDATESLRRKIFPFILRRTKEEVLTDLPPLIEQSLYVEMNPAQAAFYEQRRKAYVESIGRKIDEEGVGKSRLALLQALGELRQIASVPESVTDGKIHSPKLEPVVDSITEAVANGHKVAIFFNYLAGIQLVGDMLEENGIDYVSMTGSTRDRKEIVNRFQTDPECKVILMTLKVGGVGLNLTAADIVYVFEPWWNKAAENQAVARLHRIGQSSTVLSYSLIVKDTIEEKIEQLQQMKAKLFEDLISTDTTSAKTLTKDDIAFMLGE